MAEEYRIITLSSGVKRYEFDIDLGFYPDGTRNRTTKRYKSISEGRKDKSKLLLGLKFTDKSSSMLFEDAFELYIKDCISKDFSEVTIANKRYFLKTYAKDFQKRKISKIKEPLLLQWRNKLLIDKSKNTVKKREDNMCAFLNWCVKKKIININPYTYIDKLKETKKEMSFWTEETFLKFIKCVDDPYYIDIFEYLYYGGFRKGELFGLQESDTKSNGIQLSRSIKSIHGVIVSRNILKTSNSKRIIPLPRWLKLTHTERFIFDGKTYLFNPKEYEKLGRKADEYMRIANVPRIRIHDFRHSYASLMINKGIEPYTLMKLMGHDDIKMTMNRYGHLYPNVYIETTNLFGEKRPHL